MCERLLVCVVCVCLSDSFLVVALCVCVSVAVSRCSLPLFGTLRLFPIYFFMYLALSVFLPLLSPSRLLARSALSLSPLVTVLAISLVLLVATGHRSQRAWPHVLFGGYFFLPIFASNVSGLFTLPCTR